MQKWHLHWKKSLLHNYCVWKEIVYLRCPSGLAKVSCAISPLWIKLNRKKGNGYLVNKYENTFYYVPIWEFSFHLSFDGISIEFHQAVENTKIPVTIRNLLCFLKTWMNLYIQVASCTIRQITRCLTSFWCLCSVLFFLAQIGLLIKSTPFVLKEGINHAITVQSVQCWWWENIEMMIWWNSFVSKQSVCWEMKGNTIFM